MKDRPLIYCLFGSLLVHLLAIPVVSTPAKKPSVLRDNSVVPIDLIAPSLQEEKKQSVALPEPPKPPPQLPVQRDLPKPRGAAEPPRAEPLETKKMEPEEVASPPSSPLDVQTATPGMGSGVGDSFGDLAVRSGEGIGKSVTGRGEGPLGPGTGERGFREAKPIQTAKATYPPMALRMGLEADVTLRVFVDAEGKVTNVEIAKSNGMGFDEEALKAVKQFRFEPARRDGANVPSEFIYIYRFRLEK